MKKIKEVKDKFVKKKETTSEETSKNPKLDALMKEKEQATKAGKPWVGVLDTHVNKENIKNGFFELDWNNEFIEQLMDAGYSGEKPEDIVDAWFRTIATQMLEEEGESTDRGMGYINTSKADDNGKAEVK